MTRMSYALSEMKMLTERLLEKAFVATRGKWSENILKYYAQCTIFTSIRTMHRVYT